MLSDLTNPFPANPANAPVTLSANVNLATLLGSNTAYVGFTGADGGLVSTQTVSSFSYSLVGPGSASTYANGLILTGGTTSTVDVAATAANPVVTMGALQINSGSGTTLNVTATTAPMGQAYGLTLGAASFGGDVTFNVANNTNGGGNATGTLRLNGPLTFSGANNVNINTGTVVLASTAATTMPATVNVTVQPAATLQLAGSVSALSDPNSGNMATVTNHGSIAQGGGLYVTGTSQTVGVITGTASPSGPTTYDGDTVVGNGSTAASLTATQILQNSLTINAGSTVTIAPSDPPAGGGAIAATSASVASIAPPRPEAPARTTPVARRRRIRSPPSNPQSPPARSAARPAKCSKTVSRPSSDWRLPILVWTRACWKAASWPCCLRVRRFRIRLQRLRVVRAFWWSTTAHSPNPARTWAALPARFRLRRASPAARPRFPSHRRCCLPPSAAPGCWLFSAAALFICSDR